ncbi:hypothetical protein LTR86_009720 [Recurvomyces mirabilis]|nr:hypothetical protein LTR86_009720 [Recurvomyces mirabilis]
MDQGDATPRFGARFVLVRLKDGGLTLNAALLSAESAKLKALVDEALERDEADKLKAVQRIDGNDTGDDDNLSIDLINIPHYGIKDLGDALVLGESFDVSQRFLASVMREIGQSLELFTEYDCEYTMGIIDDYTVNQLIKHVMMLHKQFKDCSTGRKWLVDWVVNVGMDCKTESEGVLLERLPKVFQGDAEMLAMLAEASLKKAAKASRHE